jgi:hypothetical protein
MFGHIGARACAIAIAFGTGGCAIHPLPEDISGVPTYTIVRQIRCETRQAIIELAIGWLTAEGNEDRVDPASRAVGLQFANGRPIREFSHTLFKGRVRSIVQLFFDTGVAYHFELEMTEENNIGTSINLLKPFTDSKFTMGIGAGLDRTRDNQRTFAISDSFSSLIRMPETYCNGRSLGLDYNHVVGENYLYPITGRIGVRRQISDFINLTLFANLAGDDGKPPTLTDQLQFETTISGSATPKVEFSPVGRSLRVTDASINASVKRRDRHQVTIGLALAGQGPQLVGPVRTAIFTTPLLTTGATTPTQRAATEAVNQALTLKLFRPVVNVIP